MVEAIPSELQALAAEAGRTETTPPTPARAEGGRPDLTQTQGRRSDTVTQLRWTLTMHIGGLSARCGILSREDFRQDIEDILAEAGFQTERYLAYDTRGEVFGLPDQVELNVTVQHGQVIVIEILPFLDRGHVHLFVNQVDFYQRQTGRQVARRVVVTPYVEPRARELADSLGVEICTDPATFR